MEVKDLGAAAAGADKAAATPVDPNAAPAAGSEAQKTARPDWLPESYFDPEKGAIKLDDFGKHYGELATSAKAEADRLAAYPAKVEELKFSLPADLKLPEGVAFDEKNPEYQAFRNFVFEKKIDPAVGSEMLGIYARQRVAEVNTINERVGEELKKLGPNHAGRISALRTFLDAKVGPELSKSVMAGVFTASQVEGMEKLMLAMAGQNAQPVDGGARDQVQPEKSIEERWYGSQGKANA